MLLPMLFIAAVLAGPNPPTVELGKEALSFTLPAINEDAAMAAVNKPRVSLSDFTGVLPGHPRKAVVIHFFDRQRGAAELSTLNRLQRRYGSRGLQVVAICVDKGQVGALSDWLEGMRLSFPVLRDNHRVVLNRYGISSTPMTLIVDKHGRLFAIGQPTGELAGEAIEAEVLPLIRG